MLAEGIAFVTLRNHSLYPAQLLTKSQSPVHREEHAQDALKYVLVEKAMLSGRNFASFKPATPMRAVIEGVASTDWQDAFPVIDEEGKIRGMISSATLRATAA